MGAAELSVDVHVRVHAMPTNRPGLLALVVIFTLDDTTATTDKYEQSGQPVRSGPRYCTYVRIKR
jgi:hypothetical protein